MVNQYPDRIKSIDENQWLEDIHGELQLAWVRQQNDRTMATFDADVLAATRASILEVYDSDDRIPLVTKHGNWYYNFWQDVDNPRGLWRRTILESYKTANPNWETLLDIDALGKAESKEWVFGGYDICEPESSLALIRLSPDGGDAVVIREFNIEARSFVADGFFVPYAKSSTSWINENTVFVATDFGPGYLTTSGYAREVRKWHRGTALQDAETIHTVNRNHMVVMAEHDPTPGFERDLVRDKIDFFNDTYYLLQENDLVRLDVPSDAEIALHREWLLVRPKSDWTVDGNSYSAGSLLAIRLAKFLDGERELTAVFVPDDHTSLQSFGWTRNHLLLNITRDVSAHTTIATFSGTGWEYRDIPTEPLQSTNVYPVDELDTDDYWMVSAGFLQPSTLSIGSAKDREEPQPLKSMSALFNTDSLDVQQHFVSSADGTRIPYFQIGPRTSATNGPTPTILYAYGGFEISLVPSYDATVGRAWLEGGGVYVVANIRGGGEYGPAWHTSAMRENRHRAYEDFAAVAQDLIDRGVTSAEHLGCMGGSNGGLLVGNMLTHYPELFSAIVCNVPLLDMKRYVHLNAGASWIAEYGDPDDPDDWAFVQTFSPYHNLRDGIPYPPVLFYTATSDDRVGPVQARKMTARMQAREAANTWLYENMQGGHAGSADNSQRAQMRAMSLEFFRKHLV